MNHLKYIAGEKNYELSNHLGNVLAVVTDKKIGVESAAGNLDYYSPDIVTFSDYYPFGMLMPGRFGGGDYRYGFNGMEKDDEVSGEGNSYTAEFWQYDSRLGRRWNIDPVNKPWEGSYACFLNNPIRVIDPNGDDGYVDEDGNYLGDDGDEESHETRVISADKWNEIVGETKQGEFTDKMRTTLQTGVGKKTIIKGHDKYEVDDPSNPNSILLKQYGKGISISDKTWEILTANGGTKLNPFVENNSTSTIYYKPDGKDNETGKDLNPGYNSNLSYPIEAGKDLYAPIDGVKTNLYKNVVYKVTDHNKVIVNAKGHVFISHYDGSYFKQVLGGGWLPMTKYNDWKSLRERKVGQKIYIPWQYRW